MNKVALITGAAKGIGRAIATRLAKEHYNVVINYLTSEKEAIELKQFLSSTYNVEVLVVCADISKENEIDNMISIIEKEFGGVDILVNNAAVDLSNLWNEKNIDDFKKTLDVNVLAAYLLSKKVAKHMIENKWGRIINISSTNGINTYYPVSIEYDASKAALISLTHNMAIKFAPYINVNAIAPGFIGTESELNGYDEEFLKSEQEKILLQRYGKPEEVANLVYFLVSEEANYINNTIIRIDGGQLGSN
ncbi:MAG: SDR family oxidoreductase [Bacilli bacterium]|nr:SDR family oxidoreductase [Bacilli bacterium]